MTTDSKCPFCDSSEEEVSERATETWERCSKIIQHYFPDFTYGHLQRLCNSCFDYLFEFSEYRKLWLAHEDQIHMRRQCGLFKGLKDLVQLKKQCNLICRLCFKENNTEDVVYIYLENERYKPGYIQTIMKLHANDIDLNLSENPVICQKCLDAIQTFDALYQMCIENQMNKAVPDLNLKSLFSLQPEKDSEIVHFQLKKTSGNQAVLKPVTEAERAVNCLMRTDKSSPIILNGWTTKKVFDIVNSQKRIEKKDKIQEVCVISDDDDDDAMCTLSSEESTESNISGESNSEEETEDDIEKEDSNLEEQTQVDIKNKERNLEEHIENEENNPEDHVEKVESNPEVGIEDHMVDSTFENQSLKSDVIEICDSDEEDNLPHIQYPDDLEEGEISPSIVINMAAVSQLFDKNTIESKLTVKEDSCTESEIEFCELVDDSSNSNSLKMQSKEVLEDDLSDFLKFNTTATANSSTRSNKSTNSQETKKKMEYSILDMDSCSSSAIKSFSSAYEQFLEIQKDAEYSGWKFLRGFISVDSKDEEYCSWYHYVSEGRKYDCDLRSVKHLTVLESCCQPRLYRCNVCLNLLNEESQAVKHKCWKPRARKIKICSEQRCSFFTYNDVLFLQHRKAHSRLTYRTILKYKCDLCGYYSVHPKCLEQHTKSHRKQVFLNSVEQCQFCYFQSENPDILAHHISVRHKDKKSKFTKKHFK